MNSIGAGVAFGFEAAVIYGSSLSAPALEKHHLRNCAKQALSHRHISFSEIVNQMTFQNLNLLGLDCVHCIYNSKLSKL